MKKNWIIAISLGIMTAFSSACLATVSPEAISLGGVAPGDSVEQAKSILGTPSYSGHKMRFPNGIIIEVDNDRPGVVEEIKTKANGPATPGGVTVGMGEDTLSQVYGSADKVDREHDGTEYVYYSTDRMKKMEFKVVNGTITEIKCELH